MVTNTLPLPDPCACDRLEVVSIAPIIAATVRAIFEDESVSELFDGQNVLVGRRLHCHAAVLGECSRLLRPPAHDRDLQERPHHGRTDRAAR